MFWLFWFVPEFNWGNCPFLWSLLLQLNIMHCSIQTFTSSQKQISQNYTTCLWYVLKAERLSMNLNSTYSQSFIANERELPLCYPPPPKKKECTFNSQIPVCMNITDIMVCSVAWINNFFMSAIICSVELNNHVKNCNWMNVLLSFIYSSNLWYVSVLNTSNMKDKTVFSSMCKREQLHLTTPSSLGAYFTNVIWNLGKI